MNRLAEETSPYLRQHKDNPVDWYPWGEEAFARARAEDKPIMLSVGYSACHWCHVMAHESFENPATAEVMNRLFVNVKVDREERPDVDAVYMTAVQSMTGRGGWPMTVFLTPEGQPFYGGTYFPKEDRHGLPGFTTLLEAVDDVWRERREELLPQAGRLAAALARSGELPGAGEGTGLGVEVLDRAAAQLTVQFDGRFGGFGGAPKFPQAMSLDHLLRHHVRTGNARSLDIVLATLDAMAAGGMYDQLGGGFHRYSVDAQWLVPHFEKMLYDQATLARAYLHAWLVAGGERHRRVVEETIDYVLRDLRHAAGGFYSAEDADSEGEEGLFYVWSLDELTEVVSGAGLTEADAAEVAAWWGVTKAGNFEGHNILHVAGFSLDRAGGPGRGGAPPAALEQARQALFERRERRVRPGLDDKVLTGWNGMFLQTLAEAAAALGRADWMEAARANARFLLAELRRADSGGSRRPGRGDTPQPPGGRLLRSWQADAPPAPDGSRARHLGYAEDYAALLGALVTLAEVDEIAWLAPAREIAAGLCDLFADPGGFYTTGTDAEALITRPRDVFDNATPSANSLAANGLLRLAALTGETRWQEAGEAAVGAVGPAMGEHPTAFAELLGAFERAVTAPVEIAVVGDPADQATGALLAEVRRRFMPRAVSVTAPAGTGADLTPLLADRPLVDGRPTAYVCEHFACQQPVTDPAALSTQLDRSLRP
ncbi:MAG TPA: thioredoxin domain-containing protein [Acidimicrobiia bacterium]|nr:thioredoxin domain-containing protein [Acidimicrobiia bacterium]